ncbi:thiamine pyrophosphate-binding protein [Brevibacterium album]|uniref:thiamine pyrophosphate-binding protein n=1 Tax=Brevibacterium album TaxID=417948 RepID=UPI000404DF15|nr:thiamine pyrophosphate-binding protein [Brevibacterium album]
MSAETPRNGGLAVVAALAAHGVDTVFGIPGTHNLELYRHLPAHGIRAITPRHEQGAGYAADGHFLLSGRPGVVITTSGPGLTNALTAAATAYAESRPLLLLSPGVPTGEEGAGLGTLHETKDASGALDRLLVSSRRVRTAEEAGQAVAEAFALWRTHRPGPVHVEIPLDVLEGPWRGPVAGPLATGHRPVDGTVLGEAAHALAGARSPLIVAGGGTRHAADPLRRLAEALDAPLVTTANGKGVLDEGHPLALGASVRFRAVQEASREADVLLVLGSELGDSDLWGGTIGRREAPVPQHGGVADQQTVIRCDVDPGQLHKNLRADIVLPGDAADWAEALAEAVSVGRTPAAVASGRIPEAAADGHTPAVAAGARAPQDAPGTAGAARVRTILREAETEFDRGSLGARITALVQAAAGEEVVIAGDSSRVTYDGTVHALRARTPDQLLYMPGFATLGYGIPAAIGAKLAAPDRPVVCLVGDGAAMFSVQEIMTAAERGLPLPFVIVDNGGYQEIEHQMRERGMEPFAVRLACPDFAALGESMGAFGVTMAEEEVEADLPEALRTALRAGRPTVIHVRGAA